MKTTVNGFIFHDGKLLLIMHKYLKRWIHVGGHVEEGEFLDDALLREIKEETNLDVEIISSKGVSNDHSNEEIRLFIMKKPFHVHERERNGKKTVAFDYLCFAKEPVDIKIQESEIDDFKWVTKEEFLGIETSALFKELALMAFDEIEKVK